MSISDPKTALMLSLGLGFLLTALNLYIIFRKCLAIARVSDIPEPLLNEIKRTNLVGFSRGCYQVTSAQMVAEESYRVLRNLSEIH